MLGDRERVGSSVTAATSQLHLAKMRRLVLPFGPAVPKKGHKFSGQKDHVQEHYIRELPLAAAGLGCALWDGGVVLSRWVHEHGPDVFQNKSVLELGAGVALAGIMAAHWARHVVVTDYIEATVDNAAYNVRLNHDSDAETDPCDEDKASDGSASPAHPAYQRRIKDRVSAAVLDWDLFAQEVEAPAAAGADADTTPCTKFTSSGKQVQQWLRCKTCWGSDDAFGCCLLCAKRCHQGHELSPGEESRFRCDCGTVETKAGETPRCACQPRQTEVVKGPFDVIIGSELTYNLLSCHSLAVVVNSLLGPNGVFYEVLSNDRDGVSVFIKEIEALGFTTKRHDVTPKYTGEFGTRKWSKQAEETYSFYTWRRVTADPASISALPDMC